MSKREKILLIVMAVTAVGAGLFLLLDSSPQQNSSLKKGKTVAAKQVETGKTPLVDLNKYPELSDIKKERLSIELSENQKKILAISAVPWEKDIFYKDNTRSRKAGGGSQNKVETKLFSYTGIIELGDVTFAIINNNNYKEGDPLKDWTGYTVGKITRKNVTIYTPQKKPLLISYTDTRPFVWTPPQPEEQPNEQPKKAEPQNKEKDTQEDL